MRLTVAVFILIAVGCTPADRHDLPDLPDGAQAISLLGDTLAPSPASPDVQEAREVDLATARADYEAAPDDADAIIWLGRRLAYLGRYQDAIRAYTEGIEKHPEDARMYRHRGHRFITLRMFERAIEDFERAAALTQGQEDEVEPDGQPNAAGIPTSTLQFNIWYHLGLAHYLSGDFESALRAYRQCVERSDMPDRVVATSHWLYMTLRRLGRDEEAAAVLDDISADMEIIENDSYHQLLLMYKGLVTPEALMGPEDDAIQSATLGYGVGNWHLYSGRANEANAMFDQILDGTGWAAFGYLAAEAEVARRRE
jgi:tetratricopeptide (TPR) repeat protein